MVFSGFFSHLFAFPFCLHDGRLIVFLGDFMPFLNLTFEAVLGFFFGPNHYLKLYFGANGLELGKIRLKLREGMEVLSKHEE